MHMYISYFFTSYSFSLNENILSRKNKKKYKKKSRIIIKTKNFTVT